MHLTLERVSPFRVAGISIRTTNSDTAKLSSLWNRFFEEGISEKIPNQLPDSSVYGVYSAYDSDLHGEYSLTAGTEVDPSVAVDNSFTMVDIPGGEYLVFEGKGEMPAAVVDTWRAVWDFFSESNEFKRNYTADFELYRASDEVAIHISVTRM
jgi:predicted transcriptional regulator YdeE